MTTTKQPNSHQYVTDAQGKKIAVLLPVEEYERLLEDLYDGQAVREGRGEQTVSLEEMKGRLGLG